MENICAPLPFSSIVGGFQDLYARRYIPLHMDPVAPQFATSHSLARFKPRRNRPCYIPILLTAVASQHCWLICMLGGGVQHWRADGMDRWGKLELGAAKNKGAGQGFCYCSYSLWRKEGREEGDDSESDVGRGGRILPDRNTRQYMSILRVPGSAHLVERDDSMYKGNFPCQTHRPFKQSARHIL